MATRRLVSRGLSLAGRACLCALLVGAWGCSKKPELKPDPTFSMNVMVVPEWWPREELDWPKDPDLAQVQQDALQERGRPDYIRMVWTRDRRILRQSELAEKARLRGGLPKPEMEWVYLEKGQVVRFKGTKVLEEPLNDELRAVCEFGDPNDTKDFDEKGRHKQIWTFRDNGKILYFEDGKRVQTQDIPPMPIFEMKD